MTDLTMPPLVGGMWTLGLWTGNAVARLKRGFPRYTSRSMAGSAEGDADTGNLAQKEISECSGDHSSDIFGKEGGCCLPLSKEIFQRLKGSVWVLMVLAEEISRQPSTDCVLW